MDANSPGVANAGRFRARLGLAPDDIVVVTVSRISHQMKAESLGRTMAATGLVGSDLPVKFVIVGGGDARNELEADAARINEVLGSKSVIFAGELPDPRDAYDAADIVVGMGGSALRGAAFGKPVIVVGENGFSKPLEPATGDWFYYHGMFGCGDGDPDNEELSAHLRKLAQSRQAREENGDYGHQFVSDRFSLKHVSGLLAGYYGDAVSDRSGTRDMMEAMRTTAIFLRERRFLTPSRDRIAKH